MKKILTIDLGTTSVKTSIFDSSLKLISFYSEEYQLIVESNNVVELKAETYWNAVRNGIMQACTLGKVNGSDI